MYITSYDTFLFYFIFLLRTNTTLKEMAKKNEKEEKEAKRTIRSSEI